MTINLNWRAYDKQTQFIENKTRHVGFIGGVGTGKTDSLVKKAILKALRNPGSAGMITSPNYPMLRDSTKRTFLETCPIELIARRNDSENVIELYAPHNKISMILFRSTSDPDTLRGPNLLWVGMDEAALSPKEAFLLLLGRIREEPADEQQLFLCTTPKGYNWIYEFGPQMGFGPHITNTEFTHIFSRTEDNIFLSKDYIESLKMIYQGSFAEQELEGKFVQFEGLVYGDLFDYDKHIGTYPFNSKLPVDLAWDFGGGPSPTAVLAIQQDGNSHVYIIDEMYHYRTLDEDIVAEIKGKMWYDNIVDVVCDDARPDSILRLNNLGLPARSAHKGKILDGITVVRSLLGMDTQSNHPYLHIDKRCEMLIKEAGLYSWQESRIGEGDYKDKPIDAYNHAWDGVRYWANSKWHPLPPAFVSMKKKKATRRIMEYQIMR